MADDDDTAGDAGTTEDLSRVTVAASADGIVAVDDQGIILLCNPAAEELFGRPAARLLGAPFGFPLAAGTADIELVLPDGGIRVVTMRVTATVWGGRPLTVAALRDVTRSKHAEELLTAALERQNSLVTVAAHELSSPLAAIAVLADVLRDPRARLTDRQRADVTDRIAERTRHLQLLVRKLLTAARIDATAEHTTERVPVLACLLERLVAFEPSKPDVRLSCDPELAVFADRIQFAEMIANYLENAVAHGRPPIAVRAAQAAESVEIRVCDAGPGVPSEFVPRLFERFARAAAPGTAGSGLGLWIVRNFARANGGEAWYESADHIGPCFCLRLPRAVR
ncbi:hypothetical protein GCM10010168_20880 [Actinoplanes ianthinogenes]|uniref:Sensor-like histidine kinase SenX3 n=1 Tax=Actinoplanes ianthinogenes TaxID=122358 RepID=A0ABM7M7U0_9ACTN|nr:PAS domain-containing sensor histidine kinase [Actinoplanes ianthinogenes]BCJ47729.1 hypothetical protein Aiant_83860 [Actinoplanes ianthinogenes]GGR03766.1 hypothetical protein GCM10010168_20880 [Actinoplanes ianthinogenes]